MIKWIGKSTNGTWEKEVIANDYEELLEELICLWIIDEYWSVNSKTFDGLCDCSEMLEKLRDEYQEAIEEDDDEKMEAFQEKFYNINWHKDIFSKLSDDDFKYVIRGCNSQAYYQEFEEVEEDKGERNE